MPRSPALPVGGGALLPGTAIATTAADLPPEPGAYASFARDHEYKRHGTLSLLAGLDLLTGKVHALIKDRHRSREFIEFLKLLDAAYPADTAIKLTLDNHSELPAGRYRDGRCYARPRDLRPVIEAGADFIVRTGWN